MAYKFSELRERMSPARRERNRERAAAVLAASDTCVPPLSDEQRAELYRRLEELDDQTNDESWPAVRDRVLDKLRKEHRHKRGG